MHGSERMALRTTRRPRPEPPRCVGTRAAGSLFDEISDEAMLTLPDPTRLEQLQLPPAAASAEAQPSAPLFQGRDVSKNFLLRHLQRSPQVKDWRHARPGCALVVAKSGHALPSVLPDGVGAGECLLMAYVPDVLWTVATEFLHQLNGLRGHGVWEGQRGGSIRGSDDPHSDCVVRFSKDDILSRSDKTPQMRALRAAACKDKPGPLTPASERAALEARIASSILQSLTDFVECGPVAPAGVGMRSQTGHVYPQRKRPEEAPFFPSRRSDGGLGNKFSKNLPNFHGDRFNVSRRSIEQRLFDGGVKVTPLVVGEISCVHAEDAAQVSKPELADCFEALVLVQQGQGGGGACGRYSFERTAQDKGPPASSGARPYRMKLMVQREGGREAEVEVDVSVHHRGQDEDVDRNGGSGEIQYFYDTGKEYDFGKLACCKDTCRAEQWAGWEDDLTRPVAAPSTRPRWDEATAEAERPKRAAGEAPGGEAAGGEAEGAAAENDCKDKHCRKRPRVQCINGGSASTVSMQQFAADFNLPFTPRRRSGASNLLDTLYEEVTGKQMPTNTQIETKPEMARWRSNCWREGLNGAKQAQRALFDATYAACVVNPRHGEGGAEAPLY